jgi:hypothetical protein
MANPNPSPATRFRPGNCANPGGRPKGPSLTARIRDLLDREELKGKALAAGKKVADVLAETIVEKATEGDFRFVELVINRVDGKVPDRVSIGSDGTTEAIRDYLFGKADAPETTI